MRVRGGATFALSELVAGRGEFFFGGLKLLVSEHEGPGFWPPDFILNEVSFIMFHNYFSDCPTNIVYNIWVLGPGVTPDNFFGVFCS